MTKTKLAIPEGALDQHLAILGKVGSGKTYTSRLFLEWLLEQGRRVCIIDPTGVHWGVRLLADGKSPSKHPVVIIGGDHADVPLDPRQGAKLAEIVGKSDIRCIIDVLDMTIGDRTRFVTDFAQALMRHNRQPLQLVIDECHLFMPQPGGGGGKSVQRNEMLAACNHLVAGGRARGLRVMLLSQRPAKVHKDSLTQIETLIAMKMIAPQDRKAVEAWIGEWAGPAEGRNIISGLPSLKVGTGWVWAPEHDFLEKVSFPKITTFDSMKAPGIGENVETKPADLADIDLEQLRGQLGEAKAGKGETTGGGKRDGEARAGQALQAAKARTAELEQANRQLSGRVHTLETEIQRLVRQMEMAARSLTNAVEAVPAAVANGSRAIDPDKEKAATRAAQDAGIYPRPAPRRTPAEPVDGITGPQQRLLDALAALETLGLSVAPKATLAAFAGVKPTSGGYFNNLGRLRAAGLIDYPEGGQVALTDAGRAAAAPAEAVTVHELHERWLAVVTAPQARILRALIDAYPNAVGKDDLAEAIGVSPTSGGYFNNLGRLRTLGCIDYPTPGYARAADILFPEGS